MARPRSSATTSSRRTGSARSSGRRSLRAAPRAASRRAARRGRDPAWKRRIRRPRSTCSGAAAALLPARAELLCELGLAQRNAGAAERPRADASSRRAPSPRRTATAAAELRARIELAHAALLRSPRRFVASCSSSPRGDPALHELGDDRALGRTWRQLGIVHGSFHGSMAVGRSASSVRSSTTARPGWSTSGCLDELAAALFYGPDPGRGRDRALRASCSPRRPSGSAVAYVEAYLAGLDGARGRLRRGADAASPKRRRRPSGARARPTRSPTPPAACWHGSSSSQATIPAAERSPPQVLRDVRARRRPRRALRRPPRSSRERSTRKTCLRKPTLGAPGRDAGAADDVSAQFSWRSVRAKLTGASGDVGAAKSLALEALSDR